MSHAEETEIHDHDRGLSHDLPQPIGQRRVLGIWPGYTWEFRRALRRFDARDYSVRAAPGVTNPNAAPMD